MTKVIKHFALRAVIALCVCTLISCPSEAASKKVGELVGAINNAFFQKTLNSGKWEKVAEEKYQCLSYAENTNTDKIFKAPGYVVWLLEIYDKKSKETRRFIVDFASTKYGSMIKGLKEGMTTKEMDRLFSKPYSVTPDGSKRFYEDKEEYMPQSVAFSFKNDRAYKLEFSFEFDDEGGDPKVYERLSEKFRKLSGEL